MAGSVEELKLDYYNQRSVSSESLRNLRAEQEILLNQIEALQNHIGELEMKLKLSQTALEEIQKNISSVPSPDWVYCIVKPLAKQLADRLGKDQKGLVCGPYGMFSKATIYIEKDPDAPISSHWSITVQPFFDSDGKISLEYETGEYTDIYPKGSFGEWNGGNMVTAPLPDSIDEIVPLLQFFHMEERV